MQVIKNIHNPSEDFFEELFLKNYAQARSLLEFIAKSPSKESVEEKTFGWYMGVVRQVLTMSPKLPFKKDYLSKLIIKDILEFILSIDKPGLLTIPMVLLYTIEELVQIPVHKKRFSGAVKAEAMDHISGVSVKEREEIQVKYKDKIETLYKEKQDAKMMKIAKIKELLEELMGKAAIIAQENGNGSVTNIKNECMVMALLSLLIGHFENAPEALIKLANSLVGSLTGGANYSRAFAAARITEILTLRQRQLVKPTYIYKHEYSDNQPLAKEDSPARFASITLTPELLYSKGLSEGNILYIDKAGFGWIDIPPYLRFYKGNIGFAVLPPELQKIDLLGELLNTPEYVAKLLNQAMSGHEVKEEQRLMKEGEESKSKLDFIIKAFLSRQFGSDDQFSQIFSMLHNESYAIKTKFFNPNEAVFYQSCFEFYGPAPMKHFAAVIDEMLAKGKSTAVLASSLEVLCGFLRASKVFEEASTEHLKDYCYDTILKVIKVAPLEFLEDINETLLFFLSGRDPKRWTVFWKKLMAELSPNESSGTFERTKFFSCINCLLGAWLWRSKALSEEYIKWYIKNMIQDTEKLCTLAGGNLCLVLYKAFDYLKFDPNSIKVVEVAKCPYQKDLEAVVKKFVDEITDTELPKEEHRLRSIKLSLVQILSQARSHEKNRDQSQQWIIETLAPLCYRLSIDEDKVIAKLANGVVLQMVPRGFRESEVRFLLRTCEKLMTDPIWRLRLEGVGDYTGYLKENWMLLREYDMSHIMNMLYDPEIEVRKIASNGLSAIMPLLASERLAKMAAEFKEKAKQARSKKAVPVTNGDLIMLHGAILGLIALVRSHSAEIADWIPDTLTYLSKFRNNYGVVSESVRVCLSDFWKRHKSTWEYEKHKFTEDQQADLSEHINPYNYFA